MFNNSRSPSNSERQGIAENSSPSPAYQRASSVASNQSTASTGSVNEKAAESALPSSYKSLYMEVKNETKLFIMFQHPFASEDKVNEFASVTWSTRRFEGRIKTDKEWEKDSDVGRIVRTPVFIHISILILISASSKRTSVGLGPT